jgi:4-diphosphocytidyl-2-C-methyl-D-erythritol kinase
MISFPNAKINLGLNIVNKREDGYHDLETIFIPVEFSDILEIKINTDSYDKKVCFYASGLSIGSNPDENLCVKAYRLIDSDYNISPVDIHLHKIIPIGAGMGGGSSDAAFTLIMLNKLFELNLTTNELIKYATKLGSDCAFFIINKIAFAKGRGDILKIIEDVPENLNKYYVYLVNPAINISTREAYSMIIPMKASYDLYNSLKQPANKWKEIIKNDFEMPIFNKYPLIEELKNQMYLSGAIYASMSGSGSTVYGIFEESPKIINPLLIRYKLWEGKILNQQVL